MDGITKISDYNMVDYFRDKSNAYSELVNNLHIIGGYDPTYNEYVINFQTLNLVELSIHGGSFVENSDGERQLINVLTDEEGFGDPENQVARLIYLLD